MQKWTLPLDQEGQPPGPDPLQCTSMSGFLHHRHEHTTCILTQSNVMVINNITNIICQKKIRQNVA